MRKLLRGVLLFLGIVVVVLAGLTIAVKSYFTSGRLKAIIVPKLETLTGRPVTIQDIDVSLFRGVVVKGLRVREPGEAEDFARMQEFVLDYRLLPLLGKQLVITKIEMVSPYLFIKKRKDGTYNFSDITAKRVEEAKKRKEEEKGGRELPLALIADRASVRNAVLHFTDARGKLPDITADISDMTFRATMRETLSFAGHIGLKRVTAALKGIQTATSGKIEVTGKTITLDLVTAISGDSIRTSGVIENYLAAPDIRLNFASGRLDLDALMPPQAARSASLRKAGQDRAVRGEGARKHMPFVHMVSEAKKEGIRASGALKITAAKYKGYAIKDFSLAYKYADGVATLSPVTMNLAGGEQVNAAGTARGDFLFRYGPESADAVEAIESSLAGKGVIDLNRVEVRSSNITRALALFTGVDDLRSPVFDRAVFNFTVKRRIIFLDGAMNSPQIKLDPSGTAGFDKRINILADLRLSPLLTGKLSRNAKITGFLAGKEGWSAIPLKISGTTDKPSVSLNPAAARKQLQKGLQEEIEKRFLKQFMP